MKWVTMLLLGLLAAIVTGCASEPAVEVRLTTPTRGDLVAGFAASGRVKSQLVRVASGVSGRLERVAVKENQKVRRGQALAFMDDREARGELEALEAELQTAQERQMESAHAIALKRSQLGHAVLGAQAGQQEAEARLAQARQPRPDDLAVARAAVTAAQARYRQADQERTRSRKLYAQDILSTAQLEQAETELETARTALEQSQARLRLLTPRPLDLEVAQAGVSQARAELAAARDGQELELTVFEDRLRATARESDRIAANLRAARARLDRCVVRAPGDGVVFQVLYEPGEVVDWREPILTLVTSRDIKVEAEVDEQDAARVALAMPVEVTFNSLPGQFFKGKVTQLAEALETRARGPAGSRVLRIGVELTPPVPALRNGVEAVVEGRSVLATQALLLPGSAVYRQQGGDYVTVVRDGRAVKLKVELGEATADQVEIRSQLDAGAQVVVEGGDRLADGARVVAAP